jgi:hypothetical protein
LETALDGRSRVGRVGDSAGNRQAFPVEVVALRWRWAAEEGKPPTIT